MFKGTNGKLDWFKIVVFVGACILIVTSLVVPAVKVIKEHLPAIEQAAENATALIH